MAAKKKALSLDLKAVKFAAGLNISGGLFQRSVEFMFSFDSEQRADLLQIK